MVQESKIGFSDDGFRVICVVKQMDMTFFIYSL